MALDSLQAKANTGAGTDELAGRSVGGKFVGASMLTDETGAEISAANPLPVEIQGSIPVTIASAIEITNDAGNAIPVSAAALPLPTGAATETTLAVLAADIGDVADAEATGNGTVIGLLKRLRTLLVRGTAVMASSLSVTLASDHPAISTNANAPAAVLTSYSQAGVIAVNTVLVTLDCSQHRSVSIQCISMGTTGVVTPEWSNDNATWIAANIFSAANALATTISGGNIWVAPVHARYLRLRMSTATTAGTTAFAIHQFNDRVQQFTSTQTVSGTVTATVSGAGITGGTISPLTVAGASAVASAARTTTGVSGALTNASGRNAHFFLSVSAASGTTPNLAVRIQVQDPVSLSFVDLPGAAFTAVTTTGLSLLTVSNLPRAYQIAWTITGTTPSFTFSVGIAPVI